MSPIKVGGRTISGSHSSAPANPSEGDEYWHSTGNKLWVYDGTDWVTAAAEAAGESQANPARSAKALLDAGQTSNGVYWLDMHGGYSAGNAKRHYCLMDSSYDGGGWTMLAAMNHGNDFKSGTNYTFGVDVGSPTTASDFTAGNWGYDRKNTFTPAANDQFLIRRSDNNDWKRFVVTAWSPTSNSEGQGWETLKTPAGSSVGHQYYATGTTYASNGNNENCGHFNGCSHGGNCASGGGDGSGFGDYESWSYYAGGARCFGAGFNGAGAGGSPLCWDTSALSQGGSLYMQYFYRKAGTQ